MAQAIEFVEHHLKDQITVSDMAEAVSYSLYHFCRVFNRVVHHTPYDYLIRRRLSESARALVETEKRVIDIALDYGFNSPETFSRAFKRLFGLPPLQWRNRATLDRRVLMPRLTRRYLQHVNKGAGLRPVLEEREALELVGLMTLVRSGRGVIRELWSALAQELQCGGNEENGPGYGVSFYPEGWQRRGYLYLAAVEGGSAEAEGSALVEKTIPASRWARFVHQGADRDLGLTMDYVRHTWLPRSGHCPSGSFEMEYYGGGFGDPADRDREVAVYLPIQ